MLHYALPSNHGGIMSTEDELCHGIGGWPGRCRFASLECCRHWVAVPNRTCTPLVLCFSRDPSKTHKVVKLCCLACLRRISFAILTSLVGEWLREMLTCLRLSVLLWCSYARRPRPLGRLTKAPFLPCSFFKPICTGWRQTDAIRQVHWPL